MAIGSLVAVPDLQSEGPARLLGQTQGFLKMQFLASGAEMTQESRHVVLYCLLPGTRVCCIEKDLECTVTVLAEKPQRNKSTARIEYQVVDADGAQWVLDEARVTRVLDPVDAASQLRTVHFHDSVARFAKAGTQLANEAWGPQTFMAREQLLAYRDSVWSTTDGVVGLLGARVMPLPHQMQVARRALRDREVRFLLADEVGLGKTIEAGLIMQSLLAIRPAMRVLIIVPGALVSQWFLEMFVKFGGRQFTMFDSERMKTYKGNPWADEQFVIASSRCVEELKGAKSIKFAQGKWDMIIVDECHRMQPSGPLYKRVSVLSKRTPHVLLLSATPGRHHADAYLSLLHLLQPDVYRLDDMKSFESKWKAHDAIQKLVKQSEEKKTLSEAAQKKWKKLLGKDPIFIEHLEKWHADTDLSCRDALMAYVRENYCLDHRVISHRRKVLLRLAEESGVEGLTLAKRSSEFVHYTPSKAEEDVRAALHSYQQTMIRHWIAKETIPPRLLHWLLQLEMALWSHPKHMDRLLAMRATVLEDPSDYEEYRIMAIEGETLSQVMRPDLSESEGMQQIAVSASCCCDPDLEDPLIDELRQKVQRWQRGSQEKIKALVKHIEEFWWSFPQEKVLVFAGHAIAVQEIAAALRETLGDKTVCTFGAHQEPLEREEAARSFQKNDAISVMVSDPLGGEGRNFQFVSAIAHFDLPWNVASVEQRIGRVDRIGRDGDVPSWILCPEGDDSMLSAWGRMLDDAVGVFDDPASGLEFISDIIEERALILGLTNGASAIVDSIPAVKEEVDKEYAAAEASSEELYSGQGEDFKTAAKLAAVVDRVRAPVRAVCNWIKGMGGHVRRDDIGVMPFHLRLPREENYVDGVFERNKALANPELSYFAQGHQVIDALIDDASRASWCKAMAWRRQPQGAVKKWEGLRLSYELQLDLAPLVAAKMPIESLRRIYSVTPPRRLLRFLSFPDGLLVEDEEVLDVLKRPFEQRGGDSCLSPKTSRELWMRPMLEGKLQQIVDWQSRVEQCMGLAEELGADLLKVERDQALRALRQVCEADTTILHAQADTAVARFGRGHPDTERLRDEADICDQQSQALLSAVEGSQLKIASVAYIIVA